ncbi:ribonuclease P protein subunit p40-like [Uloborus diversus]|uniref:ribonuclease P protein subunit p40-like n=1 Tax=Uloborus diversus TaxID=327109 RepID=UPI00240A930A|nr:ribonuclease P protein subunit p40-like [Uloborus diversus]
MQCFKPPAHRLNFNRMKEDDLVKSNNFLNSFPFHSIHLFVPNAKFQSECENILSSKPDVYFICKDVTASSLLEKEFVEYFVKKGSLWAITQNDNAETENSLAVLPSGKLVISLETEIAECLSLNKIGSKKKRKKEKSFTSYEISLKTITSTSEKKIYEKTLSELAKINHISFTICLKWIPSENVCPQSIKTYFETHGYKYLVCEPSHTHASKHCIPAPLITSEAFESDTCEHILEWIGALTCGVEYSESLDNYTSKFTVPEPSSVIDKLQIDSWKGFYSKADFIHLHQEIKKIFMKNSSTQFVAVCIDGYQDCYLECSGFGHFSAADKLACIIFFPSADCWVLTLNLR